MLLRSRGSPPKFVVHKPGSDQPPSFTLRWTERLNEDDLELAIRLCFQSILPDHSTFVGYRDPQPTPNQQGGADDIHLLLTDHRPSLSQLPSLVVIKYEEMGTPTVMKAIESESTTSRQQISELLGLRDLLRTDSGLLSPAGCFSKVLSK